MKPDRIDFQIGKNIKDWRLRAGFNQSELGARVGVCFQTVQKYEGGTNRVSASMLWRIAEALDVGIHSLFIGLDI